jgi:hypothetical protein
LWKPTRQEIGEGQRLRNCDELQQEKYAGGCINKDRGITRAVEESPLRFQRGVMAMTCTPRVSEVTREALGS